MASRCLTGSSGRKAAGLVAARAVQPSHGGQKRNRQYGADSGELDGGQAPAIVQRQRRHQRAGHYTAERNACLFDRHDETGGASAGARPQHLRTCRVHRGGGAADCERCQRRRSRVGRQQKQHTHGARRDAGEAQAHSAQADEKLGNLETDEKRRDVNDRRIESDDGRAPSALGHDVGRQDRNARREQRDHRLHDQAYRNGQWHFEGHPGSGLLSHAGKIAQKRATITDTEY